MYDLCDHGKPCSDTFSAKTEAPARDELQALLARRTRLLTELYFLCKYSDVPQEYTQHGAADAVVDSEDLRAFLAANDIETGFKDSSLPETHLEVVEELVQPLQVRTKHALEPISDHTPSGFESLTWLMQAQTKPLHDLMEGANKTLSTKAWSAAMQEQKWIGTIERINQLKANNKWSLRQPIKQKAAPRRKAHWDFVLDEMQWMRTDFREERKWKMALACKVVYAVMDWHAGNTLRPVPELTVFDLPKTEVFGGPLDIDMPVYTPPSPEDEKYVDVLDVPLVTLATYSRKRTSEEMEEVIPARRKPQQLTLALRPPYIPPNIDRRDADRKDHRIVWTPESDEMLLTLLSEYQYNWEFVAQSMTPAGIVSVADHKSAWDCFERWVQIDPRSSDVIFTGPHARMVQNRVDDMVRVTRVPVKRQSYKLQQSDLKKQRQFSMFDAMRKIQRKRENATKPAVPAKKPPENKTPPVVPTPAHLSQMKFERDQQIARAFMESKNQQMLAMQQQRLQKSQPTQAQIAQIQAARQTQARAQQAQQAPGPRPANGTPRPSLVGQMPPRPTTASLINGHPVPNPAILRIPPGQRLSQDQMNLLLQQARLQKTMTPKPIISSPTPGTPKAIQKEPVSEKAR